MTDDDDSTAKQAAELWEKLKALVGPEKAIEMLRAERERRRRAPRGGRD